MYIEFVCTTNKSIYNNISRKDIILYIFLQDNQKS